VLHWRVGGRLPAVASNRAGPRLAWLSGFRVGLSDKRQRARAILYVKGLDTWVVFEGIIAGTKHWLLSSTILAPYLWLKDSINSR
jgi:hypothetical protein